MKFYIVALFLLINGFLLSREHNPSFRALIACDMASQDIRQGSRADLVRMKKSLNAIAQQLKITPKIVTLKGKNFTAKNVAKWLHALPSHTDDIVFFYYSGHGGRYSSFKDPWPFLLFPSKNREKRAIAVVGGSVYRFLRQKDPRLSIIIFDSCNNVFQKKEGAFLSPQQTPVISRTSQLPGLKSLFLNIRGTITSCASRPGEVAVTTVRGKVIGGIFTSGLLYSMQYLATNPNVTWNEVLAGASSYCQRYYQGRQHPIYMIEPSAAPATKVSRPSDLDIHPLRRNLVIKESFAP